MFEQWNTIKMFCDTYAQKHVNIDIIVGCKRIICCTIQQNDTFDVDVRIKMLIF